MPVPPELTARLERALTGGDDPAARGDRLLDDARRLCARVRRLVASELTPAPADSAAMELCCYALQLPLRSARPAATAGRTPPRTSLRERTEQAAELLAGLLADFRAHAGLVEQAGRLLGDVHQRRPASEQARLLSDALNLEDFGVVGLLLQTIALARAGQGISAVADGAVKREQYGYWDARLKDGFHFETARSLARQRLHNARTVAAMLQDELKDDGAG